MIHFESALLWLVEYHLQSYVLVAPIAALLTRRTWVAELRLMNLLFAVFSLCLLLWWTSEIFWAWYSQVEFVQYAFVNRVSGPYAWSFWLPVVAYLLGQFFWFRRWRHSRELSLVISFLSLLATLFPFLSSFLPDYLPSSWMMFSWSQLLMLLLSPLFVLEIKLLLRYYAPLRRL